MLCHAINGGKWCDYQCINWYLVLNKFYSDNVNLHYYNNLFGRLSIKNTFKAYRA